MVNVRRAVIINARIKTRCAARQGGEEAHRQRVRARDVLHGQDDASPAHDMANAALNMGMTRLTRTTTTAQPHMNSGIPVGYRRDPTRSRNGKRPEKRFHTPLDIVDGAARIWITSSAASTPAERMGPVPEGLSSPGLVGGGFSFIPSSSFRFQFSVFSGSCRLTLPAMKVAARSSWIYKGGPRRSMRMTRRFAASPPRRSLSHFIGEYGRCARIAGSAPDSSASELVCGGRGDDLKAAVASCRPASRC